MEILICFALIGIFILQVNDFQTKYKHNELESIAKEISSAVRFAKFLAITKGESLLLRCKDSGDCSTGLELFSTSSKQTENIIKKWSWHYNKIYWQGFNANNYLIFRPEINRNAVNGKFKIFYKDDLYITLIVNRIGSVRQIKY